MGVQAIRCGTFLYRGWNRTREIQKPLVFGGVLFHISFAVERNMAAGGIEKKLVGPLRPKVTRARERGIFPPEGAIRAPPVADTANRSRGSGRRVRGAFVPEARCGYRNPTLSSILATQMPCRTPSRSEALRSATAACGGSWRGDPPERCLSRQAGIVRCCLKES